MCGRSFGLKRFLHDVALGTSAVMCPAYLMRRERPLAQMGFAKQAPNTITALGRLCNRRDLLFVGSTDCHLVLLPFALAAMTNDQAACGIRR
jgi:hypothetical protein